jgi:hypothetical protein
LAHCDGADRLRLHPLLGDDLPLHPGVVNGRISTLMTHLRHGRLKTFAAQKRRSFLR